MNYAERQVADIAANLPGATQVFRNHKIDFCCGGQVPLAEAAATRGLTRLLGNARDLTADHVRTEVTALVAGPTHAAEMDRSGQRLIDGFGARRVCLALEAASNSLPPS